MVFYKFKNDEKSGLGMPMPAGNVRVYQKDSKGNILFVGEDRIDHTPKDEMLNIHIGTAFDVISERKQTDYKRVDTHTWEMEFEITLRNHKDAAITVEVNEPIGGDWEMVNSSYKYTKTAAWAAQFNVPVVANGTSVLKYRIRARWCTMRAYVLIRSAAVLSLVVLAPTFCMNTRAPGKNQATAEISGVVKGADGPPPILHLRALDDNPIRYYDGYKERAGKDGSFHFALIQPGTYQLETIESGFRVPVPEPITLRAGESRKGIVVSVTRGFSLCG